jgi:molecular chaperone GrpE
MYRFFRGGVSRVAGGRHSAKGGCPPARAANASSSGSDNGAGIHSVSSSVTRVNVPRNNINNLAYVMSHAAQPSRSYSSSATCLHSSTGAGTGAGASDANAGAGTNASANGANADAGAGAKAAEKEKEKAEPTDAEKIISLQAEVKDLKDQLKREVAEQENVRRIARVDVDNAKAYGVQSFAKSLLDVADNFERAIDAIPAEKKTELLGAATATGDTAILRGLLEGIIAVDKNLQKTFKSHGLTRFGAAGDMFDPQLHEAFYEIPDDSKPAGSIAAVMKTGYKLKERVLRAAQVGTIKKA